MKSKQGTIPSVMLALAASLFCSFSILGATPTASNGNQYRADTGATIPFTTGTLPSGVGVYFEANVADADGNTIKMEVELHKLPAAFTGVATHSSGFVPSGTRARTATAVGLTAGNYGWRYRVIDSTGAASNWVPAGNPDFIVQPPAQPPSISSVSPNPVAGANSAQPFYINGANFVAGCNVTLRDLTAAQVFPNRAISSFSAIQILINPNFTTAAHNWSVEIINPDGQSSGQFNFTVQSPAPAPSIASVNPNPVTGANSAQPFYINGANFVAGCNVTLRDLFTGEVFPNRAIGFFSSIQIRIDPNFTTAAHNWSVEVINPDGKSSGQFNFTVQAPAQPPSISSVNPNPVTGANSAQPFYITGANFVSGCNVTLRDLSTGEVFPNRAIGSFSSSQIIINPNFTTAAHNWSVEVINPDVQSSGQFNFTVQAPPAPSITSVSPNPVTGANSSQAFYINGANFVSGCNVTLRDLSVGQTFANRTITSLGSSQIRIDPNFTTDAHNWSVEVINPDGQSSGQFNFTVQAPPQTPAITSVSPNPVTGSNSRQPFTINGNNFVSGCNVTLRDLSTGEVFANRTIGSLSGSQIVINPNFTTAAHNWSVEVINPGGASSGQFNFAVQAPVQAPSISSVSPNPVTGASSAEPFYINGANFASGCNVTLRDLSTGEVFANRTVGSLSSSQIRINPNFTTDAHNWSVEVINPGGASSGQFNFTVVAPGATFYLSFPLAAQGPYAATINAVFDHSMAAPYAKDNLVVAYTGEVGDKAYGVALDLSSGYQQDFAGTPFRINNHYSGGSADNSLAKYLYYDGHPGYDYRATDETPVYAVAGGTIHYPASFPGIADAISYHTLAIDHGNGYVSYYLHLSSHPSVGNAVVSEGQVIQRGDLVGYSGHAALATRPVGPHLHYEIQKDGVPVDPYGWQSAARDPYETEHAVKNVNLWNSAPACTYLISPVSRTHGATSDTGSFAVNAASGCNWMAIPTVPWITITAGDNANGSSIINYSISANTGAGTRTGTILVQGATFAISQTGVAGEANRIYGVDVSSIGQGTITPSQWIQVRNSDKSFAWIRASKGNADSDGNCRFLDPKFYDNINGAKTAGLMVGAYHVGNVVQYSAVEEAAFFVSLARDYIKPGYLRPVLDLEPNSCGDPASLGTSALATWVDQWSSEVRRLTGVTPIIYCNQNFLPNIDPSLSQHYDLWVAKFTENPESAFSVAPWSGWTAFQYSQSGSIAGIGPIDLNVFYGTLSEFQTRLVIPMPQMTGIGGGRLQAPSNGQFQIEISASSQQQVIVQASDDLITWIDVGTLIIVNGKVTFTDSDAGTHISRFYRPKP